MKKEPYFDWPDLWAGFNSFIRLGAVSVVVFIVVMPIWMVSR